MSVSSFPVSQTSLPAPGAHPAPRLSIVIPTFNEAGNIAETIARIERSLPNVAWEVIFVDDDSPDGTASKTKALAAADRRVRCLRRVHRRGLSGACVEGILSSSAPYVAVMDGDLQHDEALLPKMLRWLEDDRADLVIGSRYIAGGNADTFGAGRGRLSRIANASARRLLGTDLSDPMSGFFMMRREIVESMAERLSPDGFKILLDIVVTAGGKLRSAEEAFVFRARFSGESKFDARVGLEFLGLLLDKMTFGVLNARFIVFALVGTTGLGVHLLTLKSGLIFAHAAFPTAQALATLVAMGNNFVLNNLLTYSDRRLKGLAMLKGFAGFCAIGAAGAITNVGIADYLYAEHPVWWVAGTAGALMGALWNYTMSSRFVWRAQ